MLNYVKIGEKEYPVSFGNAALVAFEADTGISISSIGENTPYSNTIRLVYIALRDGARRAKQEFTMTFEAMCDLLDDHPGALETIMTAFESSMPVPGEKKVKAARK